MSNDVRSSIRVLLAEDDIDDRAFFTRVLRSFPAATLTTVNDGAELLELLERSSMPFPDIIFLDLNMPKVNGFECLAKIRPNENLAKIPVIIYSTFADAKHADELYNGGAYYFVRKEGIERLKNTLSFLLGLLTENKLERPGRDAFVLSL